MKQTLALSLVLLTLSSWAYIQEEGIRYYSGEAVYNRSFLVTEASLSKVVAAFVVFEDIQEMARVIVNGNDCGIVWTPLYKINITPWLKAGENNITVEVINTWNNRIIGDVKNPAGIRYTKTNAKNKFNGNSPLFKSVLMGKAEILVNNTFKFKK